MRRFKADPTKQTSIMAQHSMSLAVQLAIAKGEFDEDKIFKSASKILENEIKLADQHQSSYRKIQEDTVDFDEEIKKIKTGREAIALWKKMTPAEQRKYEPQLRKFKNK